MDKPLDHNSKPRTIAIVGAGPAGLMAAEKLAALEHDVTVYDHMPSVGRKLLMAGRGGLNLTHSEPLERFLGRYDAAPDQLRAAIRAFPPQALRDWADDLEQHTFVGSSGRVFPQAMKASPLLRAWLSRLDSRGVHIRNRYRWEGWADKGSLLFADPQGERYLVTPDATFLALGGASWPRLGSDGAWTEILRARGVDVTPLHPSNVGFDVHWSQMFRERFTGEPLKTATFSHEGRIVRSEAVITSYGIEGSAIYALSSSLRKSLLHTGHARLELDLCPDLPVERLVQRLSRQRKGESRSNVLRKAARLGSLAVGLIREVHSGILPDCAPAELAQLIKKVPIDLVGIQPLDRAISTAGGVTFDAIDDGFMLKDLPGTFVAGEMLDWDAPTGGYLLQATFATAVAAAAGIAEWLARH